LWLLAGVAATVLAAWLVAPRIGFEASWLFWVPAMLVLYFPVSFDLVMGQSASFMLLGLALLVRMPSSSMWRGALALAPIAFKPPLLPVYLVALLLARRWRLLVVLVALLTVLLLLAVSRIGTTALVDYAGLSQGKLQYTLDGPDEPNNYAPTLVRLFLWLFGPGSAALVATLVVSAGLWICTAWIWVRSGPSNDEQLLAWALLPLVSVLTASYAGMYEMSTWLLTTWLLLRYAAAKRAVAAPIGVVVLLLWAAANAAVLNNTMGNRVATLAGLVAVGVIIYSWVRSSSTSDVVALSPQSAS
jgi:hypothetical protein